MTTQCTIQLYSSYGVSKRLGVSRPKCAWRDRGAWCSGRKTMVFDPATMESPMWLCDRHLKRGLPHG